MHLSSLVFFVCGRHHIIPRLALWLPPETIQGRSASADRPHLVALLLGGDQYRNPTDLSSPSRRAPTLRWQSEPRRQQRTGRTARRGLPASVGCVNKSSTHSLVSYQRPHATPSLRQAPCRSSHEGSPQVVAIRATASTSTRCARRKGNRRADRSLPFRPNCPLMVTAIVPSRRIWQKKTRSRANKGGVAVCASHAATLDRGREKEGRESDP